MLLSRYAVRNVAALSPEMASARAFGDPFPPDVICIDINGGIVETAVHSPLSPLRGGSKPSAKIAVGQGGPASIPGSGVTPSGAFASATLLPSAVVDPSSPREGPVGVP